MNNREKCRETFSFLSKVYGLTAQDEIGESWGFRITYKSSSVGVVLTYEEKDSYLFVNLIRLADQSEFDLDQVVSIKTKNRGETIVKYDDIDKLFLKQAEKLREFGDEILAGDFSIFSELDEAVKEEEEFLKKIKKR